jgi:peptidoglycan-N-acetylglucosamine deacetylase
MKLVFLFLLIASVSQAKELALTFDDAPGDTTLHFQAKERTDKLLAQLKASNAPPVIIFANPCNGDGVTSNVSQLKKFKEAGHIIGNHTCTHPRLDTAGYEEFVANIQKAENILGDLLSVPKYFRFPFFNEGRDVTMRDQVRDWLKSQNYQNVSSSLENEDPIFSTKINEAKKQNKKIDYEKVKALYLKHILDGVEFYDKLAVEVLGRSPKHIILLHDKDATVLFIGDLIRELKKRGWSIIAADEAAKDPLYSMMPKNTHSTFGILGQVAYEKFGTFKPYYDFDRMVIEIDEALGLKGKN